MSETTEQVRQIDHGGPAYPIPLTTINNSAFDTSEYDPSNAGMSKREVYAKAALQGLLANPGGPVQANCMSGWGLCNCTIEQVAEQAVAAADALLAELRKAGAK